MRTKTLLLTAALTAAGVAASMAQVYSVNVVGYVNITVPTGKLMILANPLNNGQNGINAVLPLPDGSDSTVVYRFDPATQQFKDAIQFYTGLGWFSSSDSNPVLAPGEGFFIQNGNATDLNLTFVGEVPQGSLSYPLAGLGRLTLIGSMVPQEARVGDVATAATTMGFPAVPDDLIYMWDMGTQAYKNAYQYYDGLGWYSADDSDVAGPLIAVGNGFWVQKGASNPPVNWARTFTVQ